MPAKRKSSASYNTRYKRARMAMRTRSGYRRMLSRGLPARFGGPYASKTLPLVVKRINNLYSMIETKEITWKLESTRGPPIVQHFMAHNQVTLWSQNPLQVSQGAADSMQEGNQANRIGDKITIKGMMVKGFIENALSRPRVYYRIMLIRCAKGDTIDRGTLFKGNCANKMLDQVNTERFTIVAQKTFNISNSGDGAVITVDAAGQPGDSTRGSIGTKTFSMWIPGSKFGKGGNIQFENNSYQVKFYDYRFVFVAYDWFGTPQDINNVGYINCFYTKTYFKDA
jgi:hypothetical protein